MSNWKNELLNIADTVTERIKKDPFPGKIYPMPLRDAVKAYPLAGGKKLRPALLIWSCGLFGGNPEQALPAAAAIEIYHNWTLVHDDIIDCDDFRRGKPSTHLMLKRHAEKAYDIPEESASKFGTDFAILAGDLQQSWAMRSMLGLQDTGVKPETVLYLMKAMQDNLARSLISGEAADVEFDSRNWRDITEEEIRRMIDGKTGAILRFAMQCGGAIAKETADFQDPELVRASEFAGELAYAFQLRDDWLGVFGDVEEFGKPLCSDFQEQKPTMLFLAAMRRGNPEQKAKLESFMGRELYSPEDIAEIRSVLTETGAEREIHETILESSRRAVELLRQLPGNEYRDYLEDLTFYLTERSV